MTPNTNDGGGESDPLGPRGDDGGNGGDPGNQPGNPPNQPGNLPGSGGQGGPQGQPGTQDGAGGQAGPQGQPGGQGPAGQQPGGQEPEDGDDQGGGPPGQSPAAWGKRIGIGLLVILLTLSVAGAHTLLVAQGTALSSDYVKDTMEDQNLYTNLEENATTAVVDIAQQNTQNVNLIPGWQQKLRTAVDELIQAAYIRAQIVRNVDNTYAFLHGDAPLQLGLETEPLLRNVSAVVADQVRDVSVADQLNAFPFGIPEQANVDLTKNQIAQALESESAYRQVRQQIRTEVGQQLGTSDPAVIDQALRTANSQLKPAVEQNIETYGETDPNVQEIPEPLEPPLKAMMTTAVDGLTDPDMSYGEFRQQFDTDKGQLATAVGDLARDQLAPQLNEFRDLDQTLDPGTRQQLNSVAGYVQLSDTLALVLPILALVIIGLLLVLTHSISGWARTVGTSLALVGIPAILGGVLGKSMVLGMIGDAIPKNAEFPWLPDMLEALVNALVGGLFDTFTMQGLIIAVVGIVLVAISFGLRYAEPDVIPDGWQ